MGRCDRFQCTWPDCGKVYSKACKLEEHTRSHTNTRPFVCEVEGCGKSFLRKGHLQRHQQTCHSENPRPFACSLEGCDKSFTLRHHLRRHERLHMEPCPYACTQCDGRFARREQLRRHLVRCHDSPVAVRSTKTYLCGIGGCSRTFEKWTLAVAHRAADHQTRQEVVCPECGKLFHRRRILAAHIRGVHAGLEGRGGQVCPAEGCAKSFSSKNALKVHVATVHEGRRPYRCEVCEKTFGHKHLLARHRRVHEKQEEQQAAPPSPRVEEEKGTMPKRTHECPVPSCRRLFWRNYDLTRHCLAFHGETTVIDGWEEKNSLCIK